MGHSKQDTNPSPQHFGHPPSTKLSSLCAAEECSTSLHTWLAAVTHLTVYSRYHQRISVIESTHHHHVPYSATASVTTFFHCDLLTVKTLISLAVKLVYFLMLSVQVVLCLPWEQRPSTVLSIATCSSVSPVSRNIGFEPVFQG